LLTRQVKNVLIKANKQKDIIGLLVQNQETKYSLCLTKRRYFGYMTLMERISYDYIKAIAFKNDLEKHVP